MFFEFLYIVGGTLINVFLRVSFDVCRQSSLLIFPHQNGVRSMFFEFLYIVEGEGGNRARYLCLLTFYRHYREDP